MKINWEVLESAATVIATVAVAALAPLATLAWIIGRI
jgi:hypothetical protein